MLSERLKTAGASTWLVNTGWTGGAWGTGRRIDVATTRRLVDAAISGELELGQVRTDPHFGFAVR
jgi:phosphoenolpyruvate carboxykinase (ATP)